MFKNSKAVVVLQPKRSGAVHVPGKGLSMLMVFSSWCGHCHSLAPTYEKLASSVLFADFFAIDGSAHPDALKSLEEQGVTVSGYPTVWVFNQGKPVEEYKGNRTYEDMMKFLTNEMQKKPKEDLKIVKPQTQSQRGNDCGEQHRLYQKVCKGVWEKKCTKDTSIKEIRSIISDATECGNRRVRFAKDCEEGSLDYGHQGAITKMLNIKRHCERELDARSIK